MPPINITLTIPEAAQPRVLAALNHVFPPDEENFPGENSRARLKRWIRGQVLRMIRKHEAGQARPPKDEGLIG